MTIESRAATAKASTVGSVIVFKALQATADSNYLIASCWHSLRDHRYMQQKRYIGTLLVLLHIDVWH